MSNHPSYYTRFSICGYRCFEKKQNLIFAEPVAGLPGSGITYIVGANNTGKTTIIEGLAVSDGQSIASSSINDKAPLEFVLRSGKLIRQRCTFIRPSSKQILAEPMVDQLDRFEIISSRRQWESYVNNRINQPGDSLHVSQEMTNRQNQIFVTGELRAIEQNDTKYNDFLNLIRRVIPEFTTYTVGNEEREYIEYTTASGISHKTDFLGDGVISIIRILLHLFIHNNRPLIIDEPELSLHPTSQRRLIDVIAECAMDRQIIISTHSPYFICWEFLKNGAVLNRVSSTKGSGSRINHMKRYLTYTSLLASGNWEQPYMMDEMAKELFFLGDRVLFLEGQEDVGLLRSDTGWKDVNIFGYGVRGKNNFKFAYKLAKDLGFKKVCGVLDGGASENKIRQDLKKEFPNFLTISWNRPDIRDKPARPATEQKIGYYDQNGILKSQDSLDDYVEKRDQIISYLRD